MTDMQQIDFYSVDDVAERLKISKATVFRLLNDKELFGYKIRGQWRIAPEQLEKYLQGVLNGQADKTA